MTASEPTTEELRAKWSQPKPMLQDARRPDGAAAPGKVSEGLNRVKVCPGCHAQGTVKIQSGFRVMDQVCEMCGGEGCLVDGKRTVDPVEKAKREEDAKLARVVSMLAEIEDVSVLDAVEAKLRAMDVDGALALVQSSSQSEAVSSAEAADASGAPKQMEDEDVPPATDTGLENVDLCSQADAGKVEAALQTLDVR
jgi:hypothetical protein